MTENYILYHGDCLEEMNKIPDKSIDMILCDLPYGTTACSWDVVIPFDKLWNHYKRIIKDNGCIALFGSEPFSSYLRMSNIKNYKYDWIWMKTKKSGHIHAKNKPLKEHEIISIFSDGVCNHRSLSLNNRMNYHPQGLIQKITNQYRPSREDNLKEKTIRWTKSNRNNIVSEVANYPSSILKFNSVHTGGKSFHPTQKPVELLEYLIKTYTLEGETVLDNTMGSGSTGIACLNTNRKFIGIEKDDKYFEIAKKRIEENSLRIF